MLDLLKEITRTGAWIWAFLSFGLPLILVTIAGFVVGFSKDGILSWSGRMGRVSYLLNQILAGALSTLGGFILGFSYSRGWMVIAIVGGVIIVGCIFRSLAIGARRLHDVNLPGWPIILIIAFCILFAQFEIGDAIQALIGIAFLVVPGSRGANQYGEQHDGKFYL